MSAVELDAMIPPLPSTGAGEKDDNSSRSINAPERHRRSARRRVTITDVARQCGVTPATVSRVLNNAKHFSTSQPVREKITQAAREMGYLPDLAARNLNRGKTNIVGLFASPHASFSDGLNEPVLRGAASVLHANGYEVFFEFGAVSRIEGALPFWRFDAGIVLQSPKTATIAELDQRQVPYICVNEQVGNPLCSVLADDRSGMRLAVDHLIELGHRKIAYANAPGNYFKHYSLSDRHGTLMKQAKKNGLELANGHDRPFGDAAEFLRSAVIDQEATAVITYDHQVAVQITAAAYEMGLRIPDQFSLICFNDFFPINVMAPALTAVAISCNEMGRLAAEILLGVLQERQDKPLTMPKTVRLAEELIVRKSTGAPPKTAASRKR